MDFINKFANQASGQHENQPQGEPQQQQPQSSGGGGIFDKLNGLAGGGAQGERKEDSLDKGIDWVQENVLKQGKQDNESASEQAKDRLIADQVRKQYHNATGKDFPIKEKQQGEEPKKSGGFGGLF